MVKILVADDDTIMLSLLQTLVEMEGDEVVTVTRPEEIVPTALKNDFALILLDYHLAGGNAMSALAELKNHPELQDIPVLVASGMDRKHEALKAGADSFILKPFRPAQLLECIQETINGHPR